MLKADEQWALLINCTSSPINKTKHCDLCWYKEDRVEQKLK